HVVTMRVRQHDQEIGGEGAELVADRMHRGIDPADLRLVLGFGQGQELRRVRHDRGADNAGAVNRAAGHGLASLDRSAASLRRADRRASLPLEYEAAATEPEKRYARGFAPRPAAAPGAPMPIIPEILDYVDELSQIRRDIHAHPELGFTEERTGDLV